MRTAVIYSGVGGRNGADYVAEFLCTGFRQAGHSCDLIGRHGEHDADAAIRAMGSYDVAVHASGFNLTPERVAAIRDRAPLALWTFTDEIGFWQQRIKPVAPLVDLLYSYRKSPPWDRADVKYLPLAADPTLFYPTCAEYNDAARDLDVVMVGAKRRYRQALCDGLARRFPKSVFSMTMTLSFDQVRELYNRAKIVIAPVQDCDEDVPGRAWGCPCRTFEVRACRAAQLEVERAGLADVYPLAATMPPILDMAEAAQAWGDRIAALLGDASRRESLAEMDYRQTMLYHLYRHRAETILRDVAGLGGCKGGRG